jgi:hypothetical protein
VRVARGSLTPLDRVRVACLALPDVVERPSRGAPTFFVRDESTFLMFLDDHHGHGSRGWICVRVDGRPDWAEVGEIIEEAYRTVASKTLVAELDARRGQ